MMNLLASMGPEALQGLMGGQAGPGGVFSAGAGGIVPNSPQAAADFGAAQAGPTPPAAPGASFTPGDPAGFANAGLQAPQLPDAMAQMGGLMGMMGDPHANRAQDPFQQMPQSGLMAYLANMGV